MEIGPEEVDGKEGKNLEGAMNFKFGGPINSQGQ